MRLHRVIAVLAVGVLAGLPAWVQAEGAKWGTVKGRVVLAGPVVPPKVVNVDTDKAFCTSKGAVLSEDLVVDPKTKGVRWVMVWLADDKGGGKLPIHPTMKKFPDTVVLDQPCCSFEPHALCMRAGQKLIAKNSATVVHNVNILGSDGNPEKNVAIPPGKSLEVEGWVASPRAIPVQCTIHKWMHAWVRVFDHPYFAVTNEKGEFEIKNAPAGKFRIVIWQENVGWVVMEPGQSGKKGVPVEIKPDAVTTLPDIQLKPT